jgi:hypothetical protein
MRKELDLNDSVLDALMAMSEGNPGAANVLMELMNNYSSGFMLILNLDDMNIRGPQIWVGYKDHCNCDLKKFSDCIRHRDDLMIEAINKEMSRDPSFNWKAVHSGASFKNKRKECKFKR